MHRDLHRLWPGLFEFESSHHKTLKSKIIKEIIIIIIVMMMMMIVMMMMMIIMMMMMMMMIIIIIIMIIIVIAWKVAIRNFHNLLTATRTVSNTYAQVAWAQSCANHVLHIERLSRATCRVPRDVKGQLSC